MQKIEWIPEKRKLSDLKHWDKNPRKIQDNKLAELREKIENRGFHDVIKIDTENTILSGNMRKDVLEQMGIDEVNVLVPNRKLTTEEKVLVGLESNVLSGEWDKEILGNFDMELLLKSGLGDDELSDLFDNVETIDDNFNEKKAVEQAKETDIKNGDIYQIGEHFLMCGDSTSEDDVKKLMNGQLAEIIYSDPPYNIGLDYNSGIGTVRKYQGDKFPDLQYKGVDINDKKSAEEYKNFIGTTIKNAIKNAIKNTHFFYWCDEKNIGLIQSIYKELGIDNKRVCLWIKNNQNPTPMIAFNKVYEPCVYGTIGRPYLNKNIKNGNEIMNRDISTGNQLHDDIIDLFNIWIIKRDNAVDYEHPTQKPVTLHEKAIKRCTRPGSIILDLFGGSGSTLMCAEQLKRKAYLMELNPIFCQVIINRYEQSTGNKAKKIS